jgi:hypothetical protein
VLTDRDVCRAMLAHGPALWRLAVKDILGPHVFSCAPNDSMEGVVGFDAGSPCPISCGDRRSGPPDWVALHR